MSLTTNNRPPVPTKGIVGDCGSVNGKNPGIFEYRLVDIATKRGILNYTIPGVSSNNIAEFLALVEGLKMTYDDPETKVYTDSLTALAWVRNRKMKTMITSFHPETMNRITDAILFLKTQNYHPPHFWDHSIWPENYADYNRK